ncbi:hypothetical protein Leryth_019172 [Lithospermum erythrorhizon]|nr:hypothetical protein Leryth_019172 [Lithospermum erythrorhizon]
MTLTQLLVRILKSRMEGSQEAVSRAASLPTLLCHGSVDDVVKLNHAELSARTLSATGFKNLVYRTYDGLGHFTIPQELNEICYWLTAILGLEGS